MRGRWNKLNHLSYSSLGPEEKSSAVYRDVLCFGEHGIIDTEDKKTCGDDDFVFPPLWKPHNAPRHNTMCLA